MSGNNPADQGTIVPHIKLQSLGPEYTESRHSTYVRHLNEAVQDPKNRNIALTGRYGTGKSSVLDAFEKEHAKDTVRISINTLGPDENDEDLTNRIQKELLKQLVYRVKPGKIRRSRFARPKHLTGFRAFLQALAVSILGSSILWMLGVRPLGWEQVELWNNLIPYSAFFIFVLLSVWGIRWVIGDRIISEVTTAGTKISLKDEQDTYFDNYLDEIVAFFDTVKPKYVIFEDLDRFDDPQIFDSLRELNTLINSSSYWKKKEQTLYFIYAIKDSLFEQLGAENIHNEDNTAREKRVDLVELAVKRANRTKFFEVVIPIVPFISYRNARDHFIKIVDSLNLPEEYSISRSLIDLVARHTTDMRLMINIRNEFSVFAEHLLWAENSAPGMKADHLFALVVYKNFHLADFESIAQHSSTLDKLERIHRDKIRAFIKNQQELRRKHVRAEKQANQKEQIAETLGKRLNEVIALMKESNSYFSPASIKVGDHPFASDKFNSIEFWEAVAREKDLTFVSTYQIPDIILTAENIQYIFSEVMRSSLWLDIEPDELKKLIQDYDRNIEMLRGADFSDLANYKDIPESYTSFDEDITNVLQSELARDLVRKGYITRNYAEYSAIFYGNFIGNDVAFFYNHSVQQNKAYIDYRFNSEKSIINLLEQVPDDFFSTRSVLNVDIISYLLKKDSKEIQYAIEYIVNHVQEDHAQEFLDGFINGIKTPVASLVKHLAKYPWRELFKYISNSDKISDEELQRKALDYALLNSVSAESYEIDESSRGLLQSLYKRLSAITDEHAEEQTRNIFNILKGANIVIEDLGVVSDSLCRYIIENSMYKITDSNLRTALGINKIPVLDYVIKNEQVWNFCKKNIDTYLATMQEYTERHHSNSNFIFIEDTLISILNEQHGSWTEGQLCAVIQASSHRADISNIHDVHNDLWPLIIEKKLMIPTVGNIASYVEKFGVDDYIGNYLMTEYDPNSKIVFQDVESVDKTTREELAFKLLNASEEHVPSSVRVSLARQLTLEENEWDSSKIQRVIVREEPLLAFGLEAGLFPDDFNTFNYFVQGGWEAVEAAFKVSKNISSFINPSLIKGFIAEFLESDKVPIDLKLMAIEKSDEYVPSDDSEALRAVGKIAKKEKIKLPLMEIKRIARVVQDPDLILHQLTQQEEDTGADELMNIMAFLKDPYNKLNDPPGTEFNLPTDPSARMLFRRLAESGKVKIEQEKPRARKKVRVL
ncbi:hypothetical protein [Rothia dentocariosa]|uniref:YobI family P-loop NTPase n=1 Tax=Rothia dentocariosa TaxID=2047 RepID=UPI003C7EA0F0